MAPYQLWVFRMCEVAGKPAVSRALASMLRVPRRDIPYLCSRSVLALYMQGWDV